MDRREALKFTLLAGASLAAGAKTANAAVCEGDGTPLQFIPKSTPDPKANENDIAKYPKCPYCGMDRHKFHHSRMLVQYSDDLSDGTCSIHCAAISLSLNVDREPKAMWVGDNAAAGEVKPLVEVDKAGLPALPDLFEQLAEADYRFLVFIDDLTFAEHEPGYASLKAALDGSLAGPADNVLIVATSNRRHLMPEFMAENLETKHLGGEVHPGEATEEKVSLSDRFGLWVSFHVMDQDSYLRIAAHWAARLGAPPTEGFERAALQWSLGRGARNGRVAWQFARDWAGRSRPGKR